MLVSYLNVVYIFSWSTSDSHFANTRGELKRIYGVIILNTIIKPRMGSEQELVKRYILLKIGGLVSYHVRLLFANGSY
jgi:hypothetical protein